MDRCLIAHLRQPQHALVLGQVVGLALLGRQVEIGVAKQLGRQVGQYLVLSAAEHVIADCPAYSPRFHLRR